MLRIYVKSPPAPVEIVPDYYPVKYGLLYNRYACTDARNLANTGWHVATAANWDAMITYLGGISVAGHKLKEIGTLYWSAPNTGATNEVSFNARGGGYRNVTSSFAVLYTYGYWWSITSAYRIQSGTASMYNGNLSIGNGQSVRVVKDSTSLSHGQTGTYTGNDGKVYRTICIGTQEWLADNLCETQFRNGDYIPGFDGGVYTPISNATWAAAKTAMCCVYNDDLTNM